MPYATQLQFLLCLTTTRACIHHHLEVHTNHSWSGTLIASRSPNSHSDRLTQRQISKLLNRDPPHWHMRQPQGAKLSILGSKIHRVHGTMQDTGHLHRTTIIDIRWCEHDLLN